MGEQIAQTMLKEGTRRHALYVNGVVAIVGAAIGAGFIRVTAPSPPTLEQVRTEVRDAVTNAINPLQEQIAAAKFDASQARIDSAFAKNMLLTDVKDMSREVTQIGKLVARIDERTGGKRDQ